MFFYAFLSIFFFFVCDRKRQKTCFNAETNNFDQQTACGAPVCLSPSRSPRCQSFFDLSVVTLSVHLKGLEISWTSIKFDHTAFIYFADKRGIFHPFPPAWVTFFPSHFTIPWSLSSLGLCQSIKFESLSIWERESVPPSSTHRTLTRSLSNFSMRFSSSLNTRSTLKTVGESHLRQTLIWMGFRVI